MIYYATATGSKRNLDVMVKHGFGLLVTPAELNHATHCHERFEHVAVDNGAWAARNDPDGWDEHGFMQCLAFARQRKADWVVIPDVVGNGHASLRKSLHWAPILARHPSPALLAVQDGMDSAEVERLITENAIRGVFLGGTTDWKIDHMGWWGDFCLERGLYYHVARVNSGRRIKKARLCHADSIDGTGPSVWSICGERLGQSMKQMTLAFQGEDE